MLHKRGTLSYYARSLGSGLAPTHMVPEAPNPSSVAVMIVESAQTGTLARINEQTTHCEQGCTQKGNMSHMRLLCVYLQTTLVQPNFTRILNQNLLGDWQEGGCLVAQPRAGAPLVQMSLCCMHSSHLHEANFSL